MARKRIVSRTIIETVCTIMCANPATQTFENKVIRIQGEHKPVEAFRLISKKWADRSMVPVSIVATETTETLYAMDEDDFISHAYVMDGR